MALTAAVVWMALPTYPMTWMVDPVPTGTLVTWHSWFDPLVLGYTLFQGPVIALLGTVAAVIAWVAVATRRMHPAAGWTALAAAVVLVLGSVAGLPLAWSHAVVLGLLLLGALWVWRASRAAR